MDSYLMSTRESQNSLDDTLLIQRNRITIVEKLIETGEYRKALSLSCRRMRKISTTTAGRWPSWRDNYFSGKLLLKLRLYNAAEEFARESLATREKRRVA